MTGRLVSHAVTKYVTLNSEVAITNDLRSVFFWVGQMSSSPISGFISQMASSFTRGTCPPALLRLAGKLTGKSQQLERLLGSLRVDDGKIRRELNWVPPYSLRQGLQATGGRYRSTHP